MTCIGDKVFVRRHTGEIREGIIEGLDSRIWVQFGEKTKPEAFYACDVSTSREMLELQQVVERKMDIEKIKELCLKYDKYYGSYPESCYQGQSVCMFIMHELGLIDNEYFNHDLDKLWKENGLD